jgi:hypothetical protein
MSLAEMSACIVTVGKAKGGSCLYTFPCDVCKEDKRVLYCIRGTDGGACKDCISSSAFGDDQKKEMLSNRWDWNFCRQGMPRGFQWLR